MAWRLRHHALEPVAATTVVDIAPLAPREASARRLVVSRGVVCGTWGVRGRNMTVNWFDEAGPAPATALEFEAQRLASIRAQELDLTIKLI